MDIRYYATPSGRQPVLDYIAALPHSQQVRVLAKIQAIRNYGLEGSGVTFRHLSGKGKLWEIKIKGGIGHRIFYVLMTSDLMILLDAVKKQKQKAQKFIVERAYKRMLEVLS